MSFRVNFPSPPTLEDVDLLKDELRRTNNILCDATDGQVRFGAVTFSAGFAAEQAAEVIPVAGEGRSYSTGAQFFLYQNAWFADVMAHEFGHSLFGLGEQYEEQQRLLTGCGIGPGFDRDVRFDDQWNSIMQQGWGSFCRTATGDVPSDIEPYWAAFRCRTNADCAGVCSAPACPVAPPGTQAYTCEYVPSKDSELSAPVNHDLRRGSGGACPPVRPGSIVIVDARLDPDATADFPGPGQGGRGCGDGAVVHGEQCDGADLNGETCASLGFPAGGALGCYPNCGFDTSACPPAATCGNLNLDGGEACERAVRREITCVSRGFSANQPLTCDANCGINSSQCPGNINFDGFFDASTLETAIATSDTWTSVRLIDELGDVGNVSARGLPHTQFTYSSIEMV